MKIVFPNAPQSVTIKSIEPGNFFVVPGSHMLFLRTRNGCVNLGKETVNETMEHNLREDNCAIVVPHEGITITVSH